MTDEPHINAPKVRGKPFAKGHAGKRPGTRNRATQLAEKLATGDLKEIVETVVRLAKEGDAAAFTAILNRLWPVPKGRLVRFPMPSIETAADVKMAIAGFINAVAMGILTVDEAEKLAGMASRLGDAIDATEHTDLMKQLADKSGIVIHDAL